MSNYFDDEIKCSGSRCGICYPGANRDELVEVRGPDDFEAPESNEATKDGLYGTLYAVAYLADGEQILEYYDTLEDAKEAIAVQIDDGTPQWQLGLLQQVLFTTETKTKVVV